MPISFAPKWNHLNLAKLGDADTLALFWLAKVRMKREAPNRKAELEGLLQKVKERTLTSQETIALQQAFGKQRQRWESQIEAEINSIHNALRRDKVTAPMVKRFGGIQHPSLTLAPKVLDALMEQIHNDRLRISDRDMLQQYSALRISVALIKAKPKFTSHPRVAALLARAVDVDGDPVVVTQGVHQSDDPHFDVLMPGEPQQYHINVNPHPDFAVKSISFMNGATKKDGTTTVVPDASTDTGAAVR